MTQLQIDGIRRCKTALKYVIAEMEAAVGVEAALPVTMKTLAALEAAEALLRT